MDKSVYAPSFSLTLFFLLFLGYAGALASLSFVSLPIGLMAVMASLVLGHFIFVVQRHVLYVDGVTAFLPARDNAWDLRVKGGWVKAELMPHSLLSSCLIILNFQAIKCGKRFSVIVLPDSFSIQQRSQLCWDMLRTSRGK